MARQLIFPEPLQVAYEDRPLNPPGPTEVRIKTLLSGISHGTEMVAYLGKAPFIHKKLNAQRSFVPVEHTDPPFYPFRWVGYDSVGEITEIGSEVTRFAVGDRVFFPLPHQTERIVDAANLEVMKIRPGTKAEDAIMMSLGTVAFVATQDAEIKLGDTVVIVGGGAVGQLAVQMAFLHGATKVFLVDPNNDRCEMAAAVTAVRTIDPKTQNVAQVIHEQNGNKPPDVVLECSGVIAGLRTALQCAGVAGTVVAVGFYAEPATAIIFGEEFIHNRITLKASMGVWGCPSRWPDQWNRVRNLETVLELIEDGRLRFDGFVSLRIPFDEAKRAYETIREQPHHLKIVLTYDE